jgi:hypothetical protein
MNRENSTFSEKKSWQKPRLVNLGVEADTKTGGGGPSVDWSNTTTATNTLTS